MTAYIYYKTVSKLGAVAENVGVKFSYMLADKIDTTYDLLNTAHLKHVFGRLTLENKVNFYFKTVQDNPLLVQLRKQEYLERIRGFKKMKHPDGKFIAAHKKFERSFLDLFDNYIDRLVENYKTDGTSQLKTLFDGNRTKMKDGSELNPENPPTDFFKVSDVLSGGQAAFPDEHPLFVLHPTFMVNDGFKEGKSLHYTEKICTTLNLNLLTGEELQVCTNSLGKEFDGIRKQIERWMQQVLDGKPIEENRAFISENILPLAEIVQTKIDADPTLNFWKRNRPEVVDFYYYLAEINYADMWEFYQQQKWIADETWDVFTTDPHFIELGKKRCPVLILNFIVESYIKPTPHIHADEVVSVRKSLDID